MTSRKNSSAGGVAARIYSNRGNPGVLAMIPADVRTVLDVGCGDGANAAHLGARHVITDGITLSPDEADVAGRVCRHVYVHNLEHGLPLLPDRLYDCCICSHVLEHVCWPGSLLRDIRARLKPGTGILVVALPNLLFYRNRFALLCGQFRYTESGLMDNTHFRWYTLATAQELLAANGFMVESVGAEGSFPLPVFRHLMPRVARRIDRMAAICRPGLFGYQLLLSARVAP